MPARVGLVLEGKRQVEPQCCLCRVDIRRRCARVDMCIQTLCIVSDPDGGVQWAAHAATLTTSAGRGGMQDDDAYLTWADDSRRLMLLPAFRMWMAQWKWDRTPRARWQSRGEADRSSAESRDRAVRLALASQEPFSWRGIDGIDRRFACTRSPLEQDTPGDLSHHAGVKRSIRAIAIQLSQPPRYHLSCSGRRGVSGHQRTHARLADARQHSLPRKQLHLSIARVLKAEMSDQCPSRRYRRPLTWDEGAGLNATPTTTYHHTMS
jgi:hypothetical protein